MLTIFTVITQSSCGPKLTESSHESLCTLAKAPTNDAHCVAITCGHAAGTQARNNPWYEYKPAGATPSLPSSTRLAKPKGVTENFEVEQ